MNDNTYLFSILKQPSEEFPIAVDFAADLDSSETITDKVITATIADTGDDASSILEGDAQIQNGDQTLSKITQGIQAGVDGIIYKVSFQAITSDGNTFEADVEVIVDDL